MANATSTSTRLGKQYLKQYDAINPNNHQSNPSKDPITYALAREPPSGKSKSKEIRFDKSLRKRTTEDLSTPFKFDVMVQLANISP